MSMTTLTTLLLGTILFFTNNNNNNHVVNAQPGASSTSMENMGRKVSKTIQFVSPLQSFTLFPKDDTASQTQQQSTTRTVLEEEQEQEQKLEEEKNTWRNKFLPKFEIGLRAERRVRDLIAKEQSVGMMGENDENNDNNSGDETNQFVGAGEAGWELKRAEMERIRSERNEWRIERAHDLAMDQYHSTANAAGVAGVGVEGSSASSASSSPAPSSKYQFVGVVQPPSPTTEEDDDDEEAGTTTTTTTTPSNPSEPRVKWYARNRPKGSKWNVRLVHVNKEAILRDLYTRGKIDIYGEYVNTGRSRDVVVPPPTSTTTTTTGDADGATTTTTETPSSSSIIGRPLIQRQYTIKERSWKNLWNFNPSHFFADSSGAFWRERRLSPGLYTDGKIVYEANYRYADGKNGMKPISGLDMLLKSKAIKKDVKDKLLKRLKEDSPDVVIEN